MPVIRAPRRSTRLLFRHRVPNEVRRIVGHAHQLRPLLDACLTQQSFLDIASTRSYPSVLGMLPKTKKPDALQGTLDLLVLKTLSCEPRHGYSVAARIQQITDDALRVEEGSLYPALHRMEQAGWITAEWRVTENNRRARIYRLTRAGQKRLGEEEAKWDRLAEAVGKVLRMA